MPPDTQNSINVLLNSAPQYDHVSHLYLALNWLSIELLVQHCSLCAMHNQFKFQHSQLEPPIVFSFPIHMQQDHLPFY